MAVPHVRCCGREHHKLTHLGASTAAICGRAQPWPVNALFYQFQSDSSILSVETVGTKLIIGSLSALIVYIPTTLIGYLFRRVRRRDYLGKTAEDFSSSDLKSLKIEVRS